MSIANAPHAARSLLNRNAPLVTMVSLVIMVFTANNILGQLRTANASNAAAPAAPTYFYDVANDSLFVSTSQELPPIAGPGSKNRDDRTAVHAFVYACNDCNNEKDRFVAWVEAYTPDARDAFKAQSELWGGDFGEPLPKPNPHAPSYAKIIAEGHMIAKPDPKDPSWKDKFVAYDSPAGHKIRKNLTKKCESPKQCFP
jgi:hypothetical protein